MIYQLQLQRLTLKGGNCVKWWETVESFEDKALAQKEFQLISAAWWGSCVYRLEEVEA